VETDACHFQHPPGSGRLRSFIASLSQSGIYQECQDLCSSVLNVPGTIPFDTKTYEAAPTAEAVAAQSTVLGLMGLA
jgi:hypothetical protein